MALPRTDCFGGNGITPIVSKQVGRDKLIGRENWKTDFIVNQPYSSFKFCFTANSSDANAKYPVEGFMKFSDGSNLQYLFRGRNLRQSSAR